jgi:hypothetical protein
MLIHANGTDTTKTRLSYLKDKKRSKALSPAESRELKGLIHNSEYQAARKSPDCAWVNRARSLINSLPIDSLSPALAAEVAALRSA